MCDLVRNNAALINVHLDLAFHVAQQETRAVQIPLHMPSCHCRCKMTELEINCCLTAIKFFTTPIRLLTSSPKWQYLWWIWINLTWQTYANLAVGVCSRAVIWCLLLISQGKITLVGFDMVTIRFLLNTCCTKKSNNVNCCRSTILSLLTCCHLTEIRAFRTDGFQSYLRINISYDE